MCLDYGLSMNAEILLQCKNSGEKADFKYPRKYLGSFRRLPMRDDVFVQAGGGFRHSDFQVDASEG